jgi:hypothetical protein
MLTDQDEDLGALKMRNVMFRLDRTPGRIRHPGRRLGQDNDSARVRSDSTWRYCWATMSVAR